MRNYAILFIAFALLQFSCAKKSPNEPDLTEDRGIALTEKNEQVLGIPDMKIVWSQDGRQIFYVSSISYAFRLRAVNVMDKSTRTIDGIDRQYVLYGLSQDGNYLYYTAWPNGGNANLYRLSKNGQSAEFVFSDAGLASLGRAIAFSPDNVHLAYASDDRLFLYNTANKSKRMLANGVPITFSPDGRQLLFGRWDYSPSDPLFIVSLDSGNVQTLRLGLTQVDDLKMIRWDSQGIRILMTGGPGVFIRDMTSNTATALPSDFYSPFYAWSPDGNKISAWSNHYRCLKPGGYFSCDLTQYNLHLFDLNSKTTTRIAYGNVGSGSSGHGVIAFSPDNQKIAFVLDSQIYLKEVR